MNTPHIDLGPHPGPGARPVQAIPLKAGVVLPLQGVERAQTPRLGAMSTERRFRAAPPTVAGFVATVLESMAYIGTLQLAYALC